MERPFNFFEEDNEQFGIGLIICNVLQIAMLIMYRISIHSWTKDIGFFDYLTNNTEDFFIALITGIGSVILIVLLIISCIGSVFHGFKIGIGTDRVYFYKLIDVIVLTILSIVLLSGVVRLLGCAAIVGLVIYGLVSPNN